VLTRALQQILKIAPLGTRVRSYQRFVTKIPSRLWCRPVRDGHH